MSTADIHHLLGLGESQFENPKTARRAEDILRHSSLFTLTGVILTNQESGDKVLVDNARSKWLSPKEWLQLLEGRP